MPIKNNMKYCLLKKSLDSATQLSSMASISASLFFHFCLLVPENLSHHITQSFSLQFIACCYPPPPCPCPGYLGTSRDSLVQVERAVQVEFVAGAGRLLSRRQGRLLTLLRQQRESPGHLEFLTGQSGEKSLIRSGCNGASKLFH